MEMFTALVKDKETKKYKIIECIYETKSKFIKDLKRNGYSVRPNRVKIKEIYDYIIENTNCEEWNWWNINTLKDLEQCKLIGISNFIDNEEKRKEEKRNNKRRLLKC